MGLELLMERQEQYNLLLDTSLATVSCNERNARRAVLNRKNAFKKLCAGKLSYHSLQVVNQQQPGHRLCPCHGLHQE